MNRWLSGGIAGGDFTKERKELSTHRVIEITDHVYLNALHLIYSCHTL